MAFVNTGSNATAVYNHRNFIPEIDSSVMNEGSLNGQLITNVAGFNNTVSSEVRKVQITSLVMNGTYSLNIEGIDVTYTTGNTVIPTNAEVLNGWVSAYHNTSLMQSYFIEVNEIDGTLTFIHKLAGHSSKIISANALFAVTLLQSPDMGWNFEIGDGLCKDVRMMNGGGGLANQSPINTFHNLGVYADIPRRQVGQKRQVDITIPAYSDNVLYSINVNKQIFTFRSMVGDSSAIVLSGFKSLLDLAFPNFTFTVSGSTLQCFSSFFEDITITCSSDMLKTDISSFIKEGLSSPFFGVFARRDIQFQTELVAGGAKPHDGGGTRPAFNIATGGLMILKLEPGQIPTDLNQPLFLRHTPSLDGTLHVGKWRLDADDSDGQIRACEIPTSEIRLYKLEPISKVHNIYSIQLGTLEKR